MDSQAISSTPPSQTTIVQAGLRASQAQPAKGAEPAADQPVDAKAASREIDIPQRDPRSLQYQVDGATHRIVATIVDADKTVVRQIPDAEVLRIAKAIDRMQGFLVEERA